MDRLDLLLPLLRLDLSDRLLQLLLSAPATRLGPAAQLAPLFLPGLADLLHL